MKPVPTHYLACDLGAESGRVILGTLDGGQLVIEELHRFPTGALPILGTLRWDILHIFDEIRAGLLKAGRRGLPVSGISTDSWGVDYVLMRGNEPLLTAPYHYRDSRTEGGFERAFAVVPRAEIFARTGIQFMTLNTLYQLHDDVRARPELLALAESFLTIGDYFNFLLSGTRAVEESLASTTQLYDPTLHEWAVPLIERLGIPTRLFPKVIPSGTRLGGLQAGVVPAGSAAGVWEKTEILATCSHDTGAAVAAVPAEEGDDWAYLSSGTWSLLGIESAKPLLGDEALRENFTNEIGYGGTIRFLKNIVGLWIVQECRRSWSEAGRELSYESLTREAAQSEPLRSLIHPASAPFAKPGGMPEKIADYCRATGQPVPETPGEIFRCALDSLALLYASTLEILERLSGRKITRLYIVGGGSRNEALNQATADALGLPVHAGPAEATAIGNLLIQALALGDLGKGAGLAELRHVVRASFPPFTYHPQKPDRWRAARERFAQLPIVD